MDAVKDDMRGLLVLLRKMQGKILNGGGCFAVMTSEEKKPKGNNYLSVFCLGN